MSPTYILFQSRRPTARKKTKKVEKSFSPPAPRHFSTHFFGHISRNVAHHRQYFIGFGEGLDRSNGPHFAKCGRGDAADFKAEVYVFWAFATWFYYLLDFAIWFWNLMLLSDFAALEFGGWLLLHAVGDWASFAAQSANLPRVHRDALLADGSAAFEYLLSPLQPYDLAGVSEGV